eukprot:6868790-Pyramimonas_sp.AAC.1
MLQPAKNFQMLQTAHADLAKATRENVDSIRLIQEQALQQAIQDREIAEGKFMEDVKGMIQVMKDEIAEMKGSTAGSSLGGTVTPDGRFTRRRVEAGDIGNPSRLVALGFKRALMENTLRLAASPSLDKC